MPSGQEKPRRGKSEVEPRLSAPSPVGPKSRAALGASPKTTDAVIQYYVSIGRLENVRRGLYIHGNTEPDRYLLG